MATNTLHAGQHHTLTKLQPRLLRTEIHRETRGFKVSSSFTVKLYLFFFFCVCVTVSQRITDWCFLLLAVLLHQMFCSRCVLSVLALYVLLEEISAAVLPSSFKSKRVSFSSTVSKRQKRNSFRYFVFFFVESIWFCLCSQEVNWLDQEVFSRLSHHSDMGDLSVGDAGEMSRDADNHPPRSETLIGPTEHISLQGQHQFQLKHKSNEKRWACRTWL